MADKESTKALRSMTDIVPHRQYTVKDAAQLFGVTEDRIRIEARAGKLRPIARRSRHDKMWFRGSELLRYDAAAEASSHVEVAASSSAAPAQRSRSRQRLSREEQLAMVARRDYSRKTSSGKGQAQS